MKRYLRRPNVVGAIAPSSRALAEALCEPYRRRPGPSNLLEVGAGTGAVTRHIGHLIGERDQVDICEIDASFADILERQVLCHDDFATAVAAGRVRLLRSAVQDLPYEARYDFVISGLPMTVFDLKDVRDIFKVIRRSLKPGGVFSYFEYVGARRTTRALAMGRRRDRIRFVSAYLNRRIRDYQFERRTVLWNLLPAHARHLTFDDTDNRSDLA
ncbi:MAG: class I SAM-dependent methyltransferase [Phycisphaerae bacterium]|jgi:phospholipid N-methyltransferase